DNTRDQSIAFVGYVADKDPILEVTSSVLHHIGFLVALHSNTVLEEFLVVIAFVDRALVVEIDKTRLDHRGAAHEINLNPLQIAFELAVCREVQSRRHERIESIEAIKEGSRKVRCVSIG